MKTYLVILMTIFCSMASAKPTENVEGFLKSCYQNYVIAFASLAKDSNETSAKIREKCLSKEFRRFWFKIISKSNADGMLIAQDAQKSWKTHIEIKDLNAEKSSAKVILGKKTEQHCLDIKYVNEPDLKIDLVSKCKP